MSGMRPPGQVLAILLVIGGVLLMWMGGYVMASGYDRCIDGSNGTNGGGCYGTFASDAWHVTGFLSLMVGALTVIAALTVVAHARWQGRTSAQ